MRIRKLVNYIAGLVAIMHAGLTSRFMQAVFDLPNLPRTFDSYEQIESYIQSLPAEALQSLTNATWAFFFSGIVLFILGIVTLVMNWQLDRHLRIRKLAIIAPIMTIVGVSISVVPLINIIYPILLAIFYVVSAYFMPNE